MSPAPLLELQGLEIAYGDGRGGEWRAVADVELHIAAGEAYGLIGESGSGKSSLAYAIVRYSDARRIEAKTLRFMGEDLLRMPIGQLQQLRGRHIGVVHQNPMSALNPVITVGAQVAEVFRQHQRLGRRAAWAATLDVLRQVSLERPQEIARRYPHQLSGGQRQRVVIAMAIACRPELLILDEPTTGLDVTTEAAILDLLGRLRAELGCGLLLISHNLAVVARVCDRVGVLYAGRMVEEGPAATLLARPRHPYTRALLAAAPSLRKASGALAQAPGSKLADCLRALRCAQDGMPCDIAVPPLCEIAPGHRLRGGDVEVALAEAPRASVTQLYPRPRSLPAPDAPPLLAVRDLGKSHARHGLWQRLRGQAPAWALQEVSFDLRPGRTTAVVGESGSGKTTLARCIAGLWSADSGRLHLSDAPLAGEIGRRTPAQRRALQMVFQDPEATLNPRHTVLEILARPLQLHRLCPRDEIRRRCIELLRSVHLDERYLARHPRQLSGGEKQRVAIARAFAAEPELIICDEPTSALDISVQAAILDALRALQLARGTSYLFISHDLAVVRQLADDVLVMRHGRVVEQGPADAVFESPRHAYTRQLLASAPVLPAAACPSPAIAGTCG